jgi:GTP-binding protein
VLDVRDGLTPSDHDTADLLRRTFKPVHYVVNKVDGPRHDSLALEFHELGAERLHLISAKYGRGVSDLLDELTRDFYSDEASASSHAEGGIRMAVVGRPNVGKSSMVNRLCGTQRTLVSPTPGTTHDAVDTDVRWCGKRFVLVDTAGIRRKSRTKLPLEKYCVIRALKSIERCNVALLLLDATEGATDQDARIGHYIVERGRGCIVLVNKWDLVHKDHHTHDRFVESVKQGLRSLDFAPVLTVSALTGQRLGRLYSLVESVYDSCGRRVPTPTLNQRFREWIGAHSPPLHRRRPVKFYYISQPTVYPPTFVAFANHPDGVPASYSRYLVNKIREEFDFLGAPIRLYVKPRTRR